MVKRKLKKSKKIIRKKKAKIVQKKIKQGELLSVKDGVGLIAGLSKMKSGELIKSEGNYGVILNIKRKVAEAIFFSSNHLKRGNAVTPLHSLVSVPVTVLNLNTICSVLGYNLYLTNLVKANVWFKRRLEVKAPGIIVRQSIREPFFSGTKVLDLIIPVGLGQRELIIGDRQIGKSTIAMDAIIANG